LHFSEEEFNIIAKAFSTAREWSHKEFPYANVTEKKRVRLPYKLIQPYDEGHRPGVFDKEHREGIEYCKGLIKEGKKIRPILIDTAVGQRLDGFKRYFAQFELWLAADGGRATIECIVDPFGEMGGQHNQSMVDDDNGVVSIELGPDYEFSRQAITPKVAKTLLKTHDEHFKNNDFFECRECGSKTITKMEGAAMKSWECNACGAWNDNTNREGV
jgi:hypothetical protein